VVSLERLTGLLRRAAVGGGIDDALRGELTAVLSAADIDLGAAKLGFPVLHLAAQLGVPLTDAQTAELARLRRREAVMNAELEQVVAALDGLDHLLMRGPALTRWYPEGWVRQYNDLDLLIRDAAAVPAVLSRLARHGYYVARPIVARTGRAGTWLGIALNKQVEGLGHPMYLDVTSLGPALGSTRNLTLPAAAWRTRESVPLGNVSVPVLDRFWQAALLAVELVERDGAFALRDVLDLAVLDRGDLDRAAVRSRLVDVPEAVAALDALAGLAGTCATAAGDQPDRPALDRPGRRRPGLRARVADRTTTVIRGVKRRSPALARVLVERAPARLWFALGLPVYLLPPWGAPLPGADGGRLAGLPGYRGRIYPLAPPGYARAVFAPGAEEVAARAVADHG
jgi:hypothetical protein